MRGSPLLRALLAFGVILLLGLPLRRLTHTAAVTAAPAAAPSEAEKEVQLRLTFTTVPTAVSVRHLGREILRPAPAAEIEATVKIPFPSEGVDLEFAAKFPDDAPLAALRVRLADPEGGEHEKTCWGRGEIEEVLTFP
jgi:hypothetical protein